MLTPSTPPQHGEPSCPTPAAKTAASLPAPAAGQGEGTALEAFERAFDAMCDSQAGSSAFGAKDVRDAKREFLSFIATASIALTAAACAFILVVAGLS